MVRHKEIQAASHWLRLVNNLSRSFNLASRDIEEVLRSLLKELLKELGAEAVAIWTVEEKTQFMKIEASAGLADLYVRYFNKTDRVKIGQGIVGKVMVQRKTHYIASGKKNSLNIPRWSAIDRDAGFGASVVAPMFIGKNIVGAFEVFYKKRKASFLQGELQFIEITADQIAVTIENIKNYETIMRSGKSLLDQVERLSELQKITQSLSLSSNTAIGEPLKVFNEYLEKRFDIKGLVIFQREESSGVLKLATSLEVSRQMNDYLATHLQQPGPGTLSGLAFQDKEIKTSSKVFTDERLMKPSRIMLSIDGRSAMVALPLVVRGEAIGVMVALYPKPHVFSQEEIAILDMAARFLGVSLLNINFFKSLVSEKQKTADTINSLNDGLIMYDLEGRVIMFNPKAEELFWVKRGDVLGKTVSATAGNDQARSFENLGNIYNLTQTDYSTKEYTTVGPHKVVLKVTFIPVRDERKLKIGSMHILRDITPEKEVELLKSSFISTASHQLRTPLTGIKWYLQSLSSGTLGPLTDEQRQLLERTSVVNEHLIQLVNDLLDGSRIEEGRSGYTFKPEDITPIIMQVLDTLKFNAEKQKISLEFAPPAELPPQVILDREHIVLAVQNVIDNAIKDSRQGGVVDYVLNSKC